MKANSKTVFSLLAFFLFHFLSSPASAAPTGYVQISCNLDSTSAVVTAPPGSPIAFSALNTAQFSTTVDVVDSTMQVHALSIYFFHAATNEWEARFYARSSELVLNLNGGPLTGTLLGVVGLTFNGDGLRTNPTAVDLNVAPTWNSGAKLIPIAFTFLPVTQFPGASTVGDVVAFSLNTYASELDFDSDEIDDFTVFRPKLGMWFVKKSSDSTVLAKQWGLPGDYPMVGDYDRDGKPDLVVWRPGNGNWYVCPSRSAYDCGAGFDVQFGLPGDFPIRADFDGDGILDFAVWRPSNGTFYYLSSRSSTVVSTQWGLSDDIPIVAGLLRQ